MNKGDKLAMMLHHLASGGMLQNAGSEIMYKLTPPVASTEVTSVSDDIRQIEL